MLPQAGGGLIDQIRAGDQPLTVTVVLNAAAATPRVSQSTADAMTHIVIDVQASAPQAPAETTTAPARPAPGGPEGPLPAPHVGFQTVVIDPGRKAPAACRKRSLRWTSPIGCARCSRCGSACGWC